jgi:hypothetical protein
MNKRRIPKLHLQLLGVTLRHMSKGKFTLQAALLWGTIPVAVQNRILKNAFCAKCNHPVELLDYSGTVDKGDLVLEGSCAVCGHAAARVVETSQANYEKH